MKYFNVVLCPFFFLLTFSCRKDSCKVEIGAGYTINLLGNDTNYPYENISVLNVPVTLSVFNEDSIKFNDGVDLDRLKDSVFGNIIVPDENYLIHPYVMGTVRQNDESITIEGEYAAVKDSFTAVWGTFTIIPEE